MIDTLLFDLDGTLLSMDTDLFIKQYFGYVADVLKDYFSQEEITRLFWKCTMLVIESTDGTKTNEEVFFEAFFNEVKDHKEEILSLLNDFYETDFNELQKISESKDEMLEAIKILKEKGYDIILATNPIFPEVAIQNRIRWAKLKPEDFSYITTFENSYFTKPNINYYKNILEKNSKKASQCLMVGNNVEEDMISKEIGVHTYLILDHLMGDPDESENIDNKGYYGDFVKYVESLPNL